MSQIARILAKMIKGSIYKLIMVRMHQVNRVRYKSLAFYEHDILGQLAHNSTCTIHIQLTLTHNKLVFLTIRKISGENKMSKPPRYLIQPES